jgi:hypothetical protein
MLHHLSRRGFLGLVPSGVGFLYVAGAPAGIAGDHAASAASAVHAEFPSHDPARVREIVAKSHFDVDAVRALVTDSPALAKAAWDWGFGDWESALGAASHMGRRDIADVLIEHGARPNLFTHSMMGDLAVVKAAVASQPGIQRIPGPHGITLLQHARNGKATEVASYLESLGDADRLATSLEIGDEEKKRFLGRYVFGPGDDDAFEVLVNRGGSLAIRRGDRFSRVLNRVEEHGFAPGGAPAVRVRFNLEEGKVVSLTVHDPEPMLTAIKRLSDAL